MPPSPPRCARPCGGRTQQGRASDPPARAGGRFSRFYTQTRPCSLLQDPPQASRHHRPLLSKVTRGARDKPLGVRDLRKSTGRSESNAFCHPAPSQFSSQLQMTTHRSSLIAFKDGELFSTAPSGRLRGFVGLAARHEDVACGRGVCSAPATLMRRVCPVWKWSRAVPTREAPRDTCPPGEPAPAENTPPRAVQASATLKGTVPTGESWGR